MAVCGRGGNDGMRKASWLLIFVLAIAALWSGAWLYASREAGQQTDAWIAAEHTQGRDWTCPDRRIGGYPFALTIRCAGATYAGQDMGQRVEAQLAHLAASVSIFHPRQLAVALQAPFTVRTSDGQTDIEGRWQTLHLALASLPEITSVAVQGQGIAVNGRLAGSGVTNGADTLDAHFELPPAEPHSTIVYAIDSKGIAMPALDELLGGSTPVNVTAGGRLDNTEPSDARTPQEALEHWRQAGGHLDLDSALISRASASVAATGTLRLDEAHRLQGRLNAQFVGLEPILARYGISGNLAAVGSLVSALFGGGGRKPPPKAGALSLPISLNNGRLGIGPITTSIQLTPLY